VSAYVASSTAGSSSHRRRRRGSTKRSAKAASGDSLALALGALGNGHRAAIGAVSFLPGSSAYIVASAGDDRQLLLWNCALSAGGSRGDVDVTREPLVRMRHGRKANGLCALGSGGAPLVVVADTVKRLAVYQAAA
jgi:hypothetical protein